MKHVAGETSPVIRAWCLIWNLKKKYELLRWVDSWTQWSRDRWGPESEHTACGLWPSGVSRGFLPCGTEEMLSLEICLFFKEWWGCLVWVTQSVKFCTLDFGSSSGHPVMISESGDQASCPTPSQVWSLLEIPSPPLLHSSSVSLSINK